MGDFSFVAEDLDWLADDWWGRRTDGLSDAHIRRASLTLGTLLLDGHLIRAWQHFGFTGEPRVIGADLVALTTRHNLQLRYAAAVIAGGGRDDGDDVAFVGAFRTDNPETGTPAGASEGFKIQTTSIIRPESLAPTTGELGPEVERVWSITEYLDAPGAARRGLSITRRELLTFFRNNATGVSRVEPSDGHPVPQTVGRAVQELIGRVHANRRDGVYFELLSMLQAIGRSDDLRKLSEAIRATERAEQRSAAAMHEHETPTDLPDYQSILRMPRSDVSTDEDGDISGRLLRLESLDGPIYRTIRWRHVRSLFEAAELPAVAPRLWEDPFERLICESTVSTVNGAGAQSLETFRRVAYGQCWTLSSESDAFWRIYSTVVKDPTTGQNMSPEEEGLRVRTTPRRLLRALWAHVPAEMRPGLFFGRVRYLYARDALERVAAELVRQAQDASTEAAILGTAESLLIKREPFAHEDECRLIVVDARSDVAQSNLFHLSVGDANTVFKHVTLDPRLSGSEVQQRTAQLRSYGYTGEIVQSDLYRPIRIDLISS